MGAIWEQVVVRSREVVATQVLSLYYDEWRCNQDISKCLLYRGCPQLKGGDYDSLRCMMKGSLTLANISTRCLLRANEAKAWGLQH